MIRVFEKRGASGQIKENGLEHVSSVSTVWIDAFEPTKAELEAISKKTHIPLSDLSDYTDPDERAHLQEEELYTKIVFNYPVQNRIVRVAPVFVYLFGRHGILTLHKKEISSMDKMVKFIQDYPKRLDSSSSFLHYFLDALISEYFTVFTTMDEKVDKIEEEVVNNTSQISTRQIFGIKRTLIHFHKAMIANRDVITSIEKGYIKKMTKKETESFRDLYNDVVQLIDVGDTNREILTGVLESYLTSLSNNMNEVMKKLTAYAALIMVPTLISGIYGMNFRHMPEIGWGMGYPFALGLMVISVLFIYIFFKRKGWV